MAAAGKHRSVLLAWLCTLASITALANVPALEREINLDFHEEDVASALKKIEQQTGVLFSYQPAVLNNVLPVSGSFRKKSVREVLTAIFSNKVTYLAKNNYIILKTKPPAKPGQRSEFSGYVYEKQTGQKLAKVSIYDPVSLQSATSDEYGFYRITVPANTPSLSVNKQNYQDTTVTTEKASLTNIEISPELPAGDTLEWRRKLKELNGAASDLLKKFNAYVHTINVSDSITRDWQVSFLPFVGTNHKMSGNVYNRLSLNVLGGYSRGVTGFEAGGLFNLNRENMNGAQFAGLFNIVGDSVKGIQGAGLINVAGKKQSGLQGAGLMNVNVAADGLRAAGLMNVGGRTKGLDMAGLMNITCSTKGALLAGLANVSDSLKGFAAAGLFNVNSQGRAVQLAGLFNVAGDAGFQVAGLFNVAGNVSGAQLSVLNFADSASGVPIGLLSFVKKGVHQLEISSDEWFYANLSFRTGVPQFYNILSIGYLPGSTATLWQVGYGLGTSLRLNSKMRIELNLSTHHVSKGALLLAPSELYRFSPALEYRFSRAFAVAAGPTFNLYHTDELMQEFDFTYSHVAPYSAFNNSTGEAYNQKGWIGGKIALRFF
jgi:hypothetical protein